MDRTLSPVLSPVAITGGTIDGTVIGGTTPAAVAATTVSASGQITSAVGFQYGALAVGVNWGEQFIITTTGAVEPKMVLAGQGGYRWSMRQNDPTGVGSLSLRYEEGAVDVLDILRNGEATFSAGVSCTTLTASGTATISGTAPGTPSAGQVLIGGGNVAAAGDITVGGVFKASSAALRSTASAGAVYFDSGTGGTAGDFIFRSSSAYNTILTITGSGAATFAAGVSCTTLTASGTATISGTAPGTPSAGQVLIGGGDINAAGGLTLGAYMTLTATTASLAFFNSTHADGAGFTVQNNGTGNGYFGSYKYCFGSGNATDFAVISAQVGSKLTLGGAGTPGVEVDGSVTAGHTRLFVYDVDNGTMERVTVGAADSGGAGYKLLRIPN